MLLSYHVNFRFVLRYHQFGHAKLTVPTIPDTA